MTQVKRSRSALPLATPKNAALAIHALTALGAVAGMLALQATIDNRIRDGLLWLIVAQILDGIDGPIARRVDVGLHAPEVDGHILDLVVDYVTCVVVPVALLIHVHLLPKHQEAWIAGLILFTSALWFSRTDQETKDHWFNGFAAGWNVVVPTFLILNLSATEVAWISIVLCISQLTKLKTPHLVRVIFIRRFTLPLAIGYFAVLTYLSALWGSTQFEAAKSWGQWVLIIFPAYILLLSVYRTWFAKPAARSRSRQRSATKTRQ